MESLLNEGEGELPSKPQVMKHCKDGMSVAEICKKYPDCDQDKLRAMCKWANDALKQKQRVELGEDLGYMASEEDSENVTYSKTKRQGDAQVTISANAKSMQELHDVLKLAGITLPKNDGHEEPEPKADQPEEPCDTCASDQDASYSTDKAVLTSVIRDKLLNYLKNSKDL